jgi:integrase
MAEVYTTTTPDNGRKKSPKVTFTDRYLQALKPIEGRGFVAWDAHTANFGIRVTDNGVKSFILVARRKGDRKPTKITIGRYGDWTLAEARERANEVRRDLRRGVNPREEEKRRLEEQRLGELRKAEHSFKAVAERYIAEHSRMKSAKYTALVINKDLIPAWGPRPITEISRKDVARLLNDIKADMSRRRKPGGISYAASKALAAASGLFSWVVATDLYGVEYNPCSGVSGKRIIGEKVARSRTFSDRELRLFWEISGNMHYPWGPLARALLLSAARLREAACATWSEVDADNAMLVIAAGRMKGGREHSIPIIPAMQSIIDELPRFQNGKFLFSSSGGRKPVCAFGRFVDSLRAGMTKAHRVDLGVSTDDDELRRHLDLADEEPIPDEYCIAHFTLHDIRRSSRSLLGRAGVSPDIAEKCLAHVPGGVEGTYDRWSYLPERRVALEKLAALVDRITNPPADNVVPIIKVPV